jgi:Fe-S cluster assembly iron-binding protein IscA
MITMTDTARDKLKDVLSANPGKFLRLEIEGFGWGGPRLGLALDEPGTNEVAAQVNGIDVLIPEDVKYLADKSTIDYITGPRGEGFIVGMEGSDGC